MTKIVKKITIFAFDELLGNQCRHSGRAPGHAPKALIWDILLKLMILLFLNAGIITEISRGITPKHIGLNSFQGRTSELFLIFLITHHSSPPTLPTKYSPVQDSLRILPYQ
jgi:hypothetical protein